MTNRKYFKTLCIQYDKKYNEYVIVYNRGLYVKMKGDNIKFLNYLNSINNHVTEVFQSLYFVTVYYRVPTWQKYN